MRGTSRGIENRIFYVCSHCWMIERKCRTIKALPVSLKAIDVYILSILQFKLDQVNVNRMCIFRQILEVPCLRCTDIWSLGDISIKMLTIEQDRYRLANIAFLLVES